MITKKALSAVFDRMKNVSFFSFQEHEKVESKVISATPSSLEHTFLGVILKQSQERISLENFKFW
jgi:hypothetical protein